MDSTSNICVLQCLPYSLLLQQLELKNVRELEDLLIEAVYCDIIHGKLDQRNQQVEVDFSVGRDLGPNELPNISNTLQEWYVCVCVKERERLCMCMSDPWLEIMCHCVVCVMCVWVRVCV